MKHSFSRGWKRRGKRQLRVGGWVRSTLSLRYLTVEGDEPFWVRGTEARVTREKGDTMMVPGSIHAEAEVAGQQEKKPI